MGSRSVVQGFRRPEILSPGVLGSWVLILDCAALILFDNIGELLFEHFLLSLKTLKFS